MVAQLILVQFVLVRVQVGQPFSVLVVKFLNSILIVLSSVDRNSVNIGLGADVFYFLSRLAFSASNLP